ncbi:transposase [Streptomyces sp. NPDC059455]|uniref:transposase n=1 Tax=Streptomyces sp. NPDC059455 TaxID=3346837 RepID=UPI0036A87B56
MELRDRAVRMYRAAEPKSVIRRVAKELGVHHDALRGWILQAEAEAGERRACWPPRRKKSSDLPRTW